MASSTNQAATASKINHQEELEKILARYSKASLTLFDAQEAFEELQEKFTVDELISDGGGGKILWFLITGVMDVINSLPIGIELEATIKGAQNG